MTARGNASLSATRRRHVGSYTVLHTFGKDSRGVQRGVDGMCLDTEGNIIACAGWREAGPGPMIYVFAPSGRVIETHQVPWIGRRTAPLGMLI